MVSDETPDSVSLHARRTWPLLGTAFVATVGILAFAAYRTTGRVLPGCLYVEAIGAAVDREDAPLVTRHTSDTPRHTGLSELGEFIVRWDSAYAGHQTASRAPNEMTVDVRRSCDGAKLTSSIVPRPGGPNLDFEVYHRDDSDVYRLVALDRRDGESERYEAGRLAFRLKQRRAGRFSLLHIPLLAAFLAAAYGVLAASRPLRDARGIRARRIAPSEGVFRTSGREDEELAFEQRLLVRTMLRDRRRALAPLALAMLLGLVAVLGTLVSRG